MCKLPPNATDLVQPADSFVIQKIKEAYRDRWENYEYKCITNDDWKDGVEGAGCGKLLNHGRKIFLQLAAGAVKDVKNQKEKDGNSKARKGMVMTGMSQGLNGT